MIIDTKFMKKVYKTKHCWFWIAATHGENGYGVFWDKSSDKLVAAHRFAFERHNNTKISNKRVIMHTCDNPTCVNPDHLIEGTQAENIHDAILKGSLVPAGTLNEKKDTCQRGHNLLDQKNSYLKKRKNKTTVICRACKNEDNSNYRERLRKEK